MKSDLHIHTTASDGHLSPQEVVHQAASSGLSAIAITDHDTVAGVAPALLAAKDFPFLKVIPGVEISTDIPHGEVHILGYFIDYRSPELVERLERLRNSRRVRAQKMVSKLAKMGIHLDWDRVQEIAGGGSIGRPHIAQAIVEKGYVLSSREAFLRYIGRYGPAYVEREKMTPFEAVELVVKGDGLPVLAHPNNIDHLDELIPRLQKVGLVGIEVYYNGYPTNLMKYLASIAHKYNLIPCGGSDYHGLGDPMETPLGGIDIPYEGVERLLEMAGQPPALVR